MRAASRDPSPATPKRQRLGLWILYVFTGFTLAGYATFGLHPELLARVPQVAGLYAFAFRFFAVSHVWLAGAVLAVYLYGRVGTRWLAAFALLYAISLSSELMGTRFGVPFGEYRYSPLLDPMWFGLVPIIIPMSWFFMALPSYALARLALPGRGQAAARVLLASLILLAWDLSLDPAMSYATRYWIWGATGAYYGMPWLNLFGWYVTGIALMGALALLRADAWIAELSPRWLAAFYFANLRLPLGMNAAAGLWGAVAATLVVLAATAALAQRLARGSASASAADPVRMAATDVKLAG